MFEDSSIEFIKKQVSFSNSSSNILRGLSNKNYTVLSSGACFLSKDFLNIKENIDLNWRVDDFKIQLEFSLLFFYIMKNSRFHKEHKLLKQYYE